MISVRHVWKNREAREEKCIKHNTEACCCGRAINITYSEGGYLCECLCVRVRVCSRACLGEGVRGRLLIHMRVRV